MECSAPVAAAVDTPEPGSELDGCMDLLSGHTDEEKFAGLLMVIKVFTQQEATQRQNHEEQQRLRREAHLKADQERQKAAADFDNNDDAEVPELEIEEVKDDEEEVANTKGERGKGMKQQDEQQPYEPEPDEPFVFQPPPTYSSDLQRVYEAVGDTFLARLLRTAPDDGEEPVYQTLAVVVMCTLCSSEDVAIQFSVLVDDLSKLLDSTSAEVRANALECLARIAGALAKNHERWVWQYFGERTAVALIARLSRADEPEEDGDDDDDDDYDGEKQAMAALSEQSQLMMGAILVFIVSSCPAKLLPRWAWAQLPALARLFATNQEQLKFQLLRVMNTLVAAHPGERASGGAQPSIWTLHVRTALCDLLSSLVTDEQRRGALRLSLRMLEAFGWKWAIAPHVEVGRRMEPRVVRNPNRPDGPAPAQQEQAQPPPPHEKYVQVLMNQLAIEVRVILMVEAGPKPRQEHLASIVTCFRAVEMLLQCLVGGGEEGEEVVEGQQQPELSGQTLMFFKQRFDELFLGVFNFLRESQTASRNKDALVVACVRVLGAWLTEETEALRKDVEELLPFILTVQDPDEDDTHPRDPLRFVLAPLAEIVLDAGPRESAVEGKVPQRCVAILSAHTRGLRRHKGNQPFYSSAAADDDDDDSDDKNQQETEDQQQSIEELTSCAETLRNLLFTAKTAQDGVVVALCPLLSQLSDLIQVLITQNAWQREAEGVALANLCVAVLFLLRRCGPKQCDADAVAVVWGHILRFLDGGALGVSSLRELVTVGIDSMGECITSHPSLKSVFKDSPLFETLSVVAASPAEDASLRQILRKLIAKCGP